jgi:serine/threonine protein kinase
MRPPPDRMRLSPASDRPGGGPPTPTPATEVIRPHPRAWEVGARFSTYEIDSLLASGGMAEVWRAKIKGMEGFEKRIVIKTMLTQYQDRSDVVEMFVTEASLAARLSHPNIVDVIDFGQLEGRYFIAMEYVPGMSLRFAQKRMRSRGGRLPVAAVLHVARDVCEALQYMHDLEDASGEMGLIHRDLSPDNIIMSTSGTTKLIDFGTARATLRSPPSPSFVGKFRYAAPERIKQQGEDNRSDIYSLGVILYESLVGARPFEGTDADVIRLVTSNVACDPRAAAADVPASVAEVVKKATAANPAHRYATAQAMGTALARCLVELAATNKEREVTGALAILLDEGPARPAVDASGVTAPAPPPPRREAIPQPVAGPEDPESGVVAIHELEIIEASGPIRDFVEREPSIEPIPASDTEKISITLPPEAFPAGTEPPDEDDAAGIPAGPILDSASAAAWTPPPDMAMMAPTPPPVLLGTANLNDAIRGAIAGSSATRLRGWHRGPVSTQETKQSDWAVAIFDQGIEMRLEGRYEEALEAWELAARLAPENHLYRAQINKLRAQLQARARR